MLCTQCFILASKQRTLKPVVRSVKKLKTYLLGIKFVIYSDCKAFEQTMKKKDLCTRIARWALILGEYDYEVQEYYVKKQQKRIKEVISNCVHFDFKEGR